MLNATRPVAARRSRLAVSSDASPYCPLHRRRFSTHIRWATLTASRRRESSVLFSRSSPVTRPSIGRNRAPRNCEPNRDCHTSARELSNINRAPGSEDVPVRRTHLARSASLDALARWPTPERVRWRPPQSRWRRPVGSLPRPSVALQIEIEIRRFGSLYHGH